MKKIDLTCAGCGATMELNEEKNMAICPFCKNQFYLEKEPDIEKLAENKEKLVYAEEMGRRKAIEHHQRKQNIQKLAAVLIVILIIFTFFTVRLCTYIASLERIEDPFECIDVEFRGDNYSGILDINDNKKCEYFYELKYKASKEYNLIEDEKIKIVVSSSNYLFGTREKEYTVKGLNSYLIDLNELTSEMIKKIHTLSSSTVKVKSIGTYYNGKVKSLTPYKLYLLTNKKDKNYLFDVYKLVNKSTSGKTYTKYVVAYYENFVFTNNEDLFKYTKLSYAGDMIYAGSTNKSIFKEGMGYIYGFNNMNEFESYLTQKYDSSLVKTIK